MILIWYPLKRCRFRTLPAPHWRSKADGLRHLMTDEIAPDSRAAPGPEGYVPHAATDRHQGRWIMVPPRGLEGHETP
jgi:hypothetical protein